jgi:hypothetical protein
MSFAVLGCRAAVWKFLQLIRRHLPQGPVASARQQEEPQEEGNHVNSNEEAYDVAVSQEYVLVCSLSTKAKNLNRGAQGRVEHAKVQESICSPNSE